MSEWKSVKEELPKIGWYLVFGHNPSYDGDNGGMMFETYFDPTTGWEKVFEKQRVYFWRDLPEAPEENNE